MSVKHFLDKDKLFRMSGGEQSFFDVETRVTRGTVDGGTLPTDTPGLSTETWSESLFVGRDHTTMPEDNSVTFGNMTDVVQFNREARGPATTGGTARHGVTFMDPGGSAGQSRVTARPSVAMPQAHEDHALTHVIVDSHSRGRTTQPNTASTSATDGAIAGPSGVTNTDRRGSPRDDTTMGVDGGDDDDDVLSVETHVSENGSSIDLGRENLLAKICKAILRIVRPRANDDGHFCAVFLMKNGWVYWLRDIIQECKTRAQQLGLRLVVPDWGRYDIPNNLLVILNSFDYEAFVHPDVTRLHVKYVRQVRAVRSMFPDPRGETSVVYNIMSLVNEWMKITDVMRSKIDYVRACIRERERLDNIVANVDRITQLEGGPEKLNAARNLLEDFNTCVHVMNENFNKATTGQIEGERECRGFLDRFGLSITANVTLRDVIKTIREAGDYRFFFFNNARRDVGEEMRTLYRDYTIRLQSVSIGGNVNISSSEDEEELYDVEHVTIRQRRDDTTTRQASTPANSSAPAVNYNTTVVRSQGDGPRRNGNIIPTRLAMTTNGDQVPEATQRTQNSNVTVNNLRRPVSPGPRFYQRHENQGRRNRNDDRRDRNYEERDRDDDDRDRDDDGRVRNVDRRNTWRRDSHEKVRLLKRRILRHLEDAEDLIVRYNNNTSEVSTEDVHTTIDRLNDIQKKHDSLIEEGAGEMLRLMLKLQ